MSWKKVFSWWIKRILNAETLCRYTSRLRCHFEPCSLIKFFFFLLPVSGWLWRKKKLRKKLSQFTASRAVSEDKIPKKIQSFHCQQTQPIALATGYRLLLSLEIITIPWSMKTDTDIISCKFKKNIYKGKLSWGCFVSDVIKFWKFMKKVNFLFLFYSGFHCSLQT